MSFQFEDDSALEELLNQQLDRKRQQQPILSRNAPNRPVTAAQPSSAYSSSSNIRSSAGNKNNNERPSTGLASKAQQGPAKGAEMKLTDSEPTIDARQQSSGKLARWLDSRVGGESSANADNTASRVQSRKGLALDEQEISTIVDSVERPIVSSRALELVSAKQPQVDSDDKSMDLLLLKETLREDRLQEMSKQRLIQLILNQVVPTLESYLIKAKDQSRLSNDRLTRQLREELALEKQRVESLEVSKREQMELIESKWMKLNKQLELQLEISERELSNTIGRHKSSLNELESEHKQQLDRLIESYEERMRLEKERFEETIKRRDEFHRLELEAKMKINCDVNKLEFIFTQWDQMIQSTLSNLNTQYKSIEGLLDKQTEAINGSNVELSKKALKLGGHFDKFEKLNEELNQLSKTMSTVLPEFVKAQEEKEAVVKRMDTRLEELMKRNDQLSTDRLQVERLRNELDESREELAKDKLQLAMETNRLAYKEEHLGELIKTNRETGTKLAELKEKLDEREIKLEKLRSNLEVKGDKLREQNFELHLTRKKLTVENDRLVQLDTKLEKERKSVDAQIKQLENSRTKLNSVRLRCGKEFNLLNRLQRSLVCTICLERLFPNKSVTKAITDDQKSGCNSNDDDGLLNNHHIGYLPMGQQVQLQNSSSSKFNNKFDFGQELAKLRRHIETDAKQLETENKYVELLSAAG